MLTLYTFGDSILDCGPYNQHGTHPAQLVVQNDNELFPEFRGQDLRSLLPGVIRLDHRAQGGSVLRDLFTQALDLEIEQPAIALITIGGNDLIDRLFEDPGLGFAGFAATLELFLARLPVHPILLGNVYDPTFGQDDPEFFGWNPKRARANLARLNDILADIASRHGALVDLYSHFLAGRPEWFTSVIEPSLLGASELRRCFLQATLPLLINEHVED
jgi:acyl-CoA thioesterase I